MWAERVQRYSTEARFRECVELSSTQAISFHDALRLSRAQRHAFVSVWNEIQTRQADEVKRKQTPLPQGKR